MKYIKYIALSMVTVIGMTSCNDHFLDKTPDERVELNSVTSIQQALAGAYPDANYGWVCEISSDNVMDNNSPHYPASSNSNQILAHYNLSSNRVDDEMFSFQPARSSTGSDTPYAIWTSFYQSVAAVNNVLQSIDRIRTQQGETLSASDQRKLNGAEGEARLIRAYDHFILVNVFSQAYKDSIRSKEDVGVPYVTVPETKPNAHYERGTVEEDYEKIEADLQKGLELIGNASFDVPKYHFNQNAAEAFAARFYLFKRDYDKVIQYANAVLGTNDDATLGNMMKYDSRLEACVNTSDFANVFQDPNDNNNIMLLNTYSTMMRKAYSSRYAVNSTPAREIFYHSAPMWRGWVVNPTAILSGMFGNSEYGYVMGKVAEQFQMTDKISQTGYVHTIRREFTTSELVLERAEAKVMKDDLDGAFNDLLLYDRSLTSYSSQSIASYFSNNRMALLTKDMINNWFATEGNPNCFGSWAFTQKMSPSFVVPADAVAYMNCINYFRRFETVYDGNRFFDLKRWGIEYSHTMGANSTVYTLTWNDPRRAIEVPDAAISAGLEPSRPLSQDSVTLSSRNISDYMVKK